MADAGQQQTRRQQRFERRMTDAEALMWNVEKDPWLNPNGGVLAILDQPPDMEDFERRIAFALSEVPRLRERVVPTLGRLSPPIWRTDVEFDLAYHIRRVALAEPGTTRQLLDLLAMIHQDPFDRSRPLWQFYVVEGLEDGRAALLWKIHHSLTDGIGMGFLAEYHLQRERDAPPPAKVDVDELVQAAAHAEEAEAAKKPSLPVAVLRTTNHQWRRQAGRARRAAGEVALWGADPTRVTDAFGQVVKAVQQARGQFVGTGEGAGGSPLWRTRSRRRHFEILDVPLAPAREAARALGGTLNDLFVTGAVMGILAYHDHRGVPVDSIHGSFVVSTRTDKAIGGNSFTPTRVRLPGDAMTPKERFVDIRDRLTAKRSEVTGAGMFNNLAGLANLLPTSVMTQAARSQATRQDFATSNVRGPRAPRYVSGAQIVGYYPFGPVAGTAFNLTTLSYMDQLEMGLFVDPAAVNDPGELRDDIANGFRDLIEAAGVT